MNTLVTYQEKVSKYAEKARVGVSKVVEPDYDTRHM